jgi:hypothetical protein
MSEMVFIAQANGDLSFFSDYMPFYLAYETADYNRRPFYWLAKIIPLKKIAPQFSHLEVIC